MHYEIEIHELYDEDGGNESNEFKISNRRYSTKIP